VRERDVGLATASAGDRGTTRPSASSLDVYAAVLPDKSARDLRGGPRFPDAMLHSGSAIRAADIGV